MSVDTTNFSTGAIRSTDANDLDFVSISPIAMIALAKTCAEGATKYGRHNWEQGMPVHDLLNHVKLHLTLYEAGDRTEPHLPHAFWGLMAAIHSDVCWPELNEPHLRGPGCTLTNGMRRELEAGKARRDADRNAGLFATLGGWVLGLVPQVAKILGQRRDCLARMAAVEPCTEEEYNQINRIGYGVISLEESRLLQRTQYLISDDYVITRIEPDFGAPDPINGERWTCFENHVRVYYRAMNRETQ